MRQAIRCIDKLNDKVGMTARWLAVAMILSTSCEVLARYFFNAPTVWAHQTVMRRGGVEDRARAAVSTSDHEAEIDCVAPSEGLP